MFKCAIFLSLRLGAHVFRFKLTENHQLSYVTLSFIATMWPELEKNLDKVFDWIRPEMIQVGTFGLSSDTLESRPFPCRPLTRGYHV